MVWANIVRPYGYAVSYTHLWLARVLSENAIFPTHFSKYGAAYQTMLREDRSPQFGSETIHINEKGEIYCA